MYNLYGNDWWKVCCIDESVIKKLEEKKIYFSFAYIGMARCYKHNQLIWQVFSPTIGWGSEDYLINEVKECIKFFIENGYIPNMENV